jgi:cyclohexanecarboxylate-CoA ligase
MRVTADAVRKHRATGWWDDIRLHDLVHRGAVSAPEALATVGTGFGAAERRLTYAELSEEVSSVANALANLGIRPHDVLSVQLPNWTEFLVLLFAASQLGAVFCPITHIYRQRELGFILDRTRTKVAVIPARFRNVDHSAMLRDLRPGLPELHHVVEVTRTASGSDMISYQDLIDMGRAITSDASAAAASADDVVILAFTSGTTGEPKGVMHTHNTLQAVIRGVVQQLDLDRPMVNLVVSPVGHLTGVIWGCLMTVMLGGTVVFQERWNAAEAVGRIDSEGVTIMAGATPFLKDLCETELPSRGVPTLSAFLCAGAPIPPHTVTLARDRLGCRVYSAWGLSEYPIGTAVGGDDDQSLASTSDGRACPGASVRLVDEQSIPADVGSEGNLEIQGPGMFVGYYKRPDFTRASFTPDGFLMTGDRAYYVNEQGFIRISGRTKDIIIRGGENIPVVEVENLLHQHPRVADVAVVAMPDDRLGERACAYVVAASGTSDLTLRDLTDFLQEAGMARHFLPERLELVPELPRTPSGKVQKVRLRADIARKVALGLRSAEAPKTAVPNSLPSVSDGQSAAPKEE